MAITACKLTVAVLSIISWLSFASCRSIRTIDLDDFYHEISYLLSGRDTDNTEESFPQPIEIQGWPKEDLNLGQVAGVTVNGEGNPVLFQRGNNVWDYDSFNETDHYQLIDKGPIPNDTIITLDRDSGKILNSWGGHKFYLPHGITTDKQGNTWVTDVALHQVFKFAPNSEIPSLILGEAFHPGTDKQHFCKPTDVAVANTGEFFISDGYCNSRILKYSSQGVLQAEWGHSNGHRDFLVPHSLTLLEEQDLLCVADRENKRIVCYSAGLSALPPGRLLFQIHSKQIGRIFAVTGKGETIYAVTGPTAHLIPIGITINIKKQEILNSWRPLTGFYQPHDVAISPDGIELYVAEIGPNRVTKFRIRQRYHQAEI